MNGQIQIESTMSIENQNLKETVNPKLKGTLNSKLKDMLNKLKGQLSIEVKCTITYRNQKEH